jgi:hypothetical protein
MPDDTTPISSTFQAISARLIRRRSAAAILALSATSPLGPRSSGQIHVAHAVSLLNQYPEPSA